MLKNNIPIVLASDNGHSKYMLVTMVSILENKNEGSFYDFYLMTTPDFSKENKEILLRHVNKYPNKKINFIDMGDSFSNLEQLIPHITYPTYYRLMVADKLPLEYKKCIYFDTDVIVNCDLNEYFDFDLTDYYIAGVKAPGWFIDETRANNFINMSPNLRCDTYINAGITLWNLEKIRNNNKSEQLYKLTEKKYNDQDIINIAFYEKIKTISPKYNVMTPRLNEEDKDLLKGYSKQDIYDFRNNQLFIHYADRIKPWNNKKSILADIWWEYAKKTDIYEELNTMAEAFQNYIVPSNNAIEIMNSIEDEISSYSEMLKSEREFLTEIILKEQPKKCLEMGVSMGGSSAIILNTIKDIEGSKLYSIDLNEYFYKDNTQKTGFIVDNFPELKSKWQLFAGKMAYEYMETIGKDIDFCLIDTVHSNPGEILDFLIALPYLKDGAIVVFHDTAYHTKIKFNFGVLGYGYGNTCGLCMSAINGEKLIQGNFKDETANLPDTSYHFPNIGAVRITSETRKHIFELFNLLTIHWTYEIDDKTLKELSKYYEMHYGKEWSSYFDRVCKFQKRLKKAKDEMYAPQNKEVMEYRDSYSFMEKIFSVKNQYTSDKKHKVLCVLGIKMKFKK